VVAQGKLKFNYVSIIGILSFVITSKYFYIRMAEESASGCITVRDVPAPKFIAAYADVLKNNDKFELKNDKRQTAARLSKYEMVRILGERTKHLTMGAKPMVKNYESLSYEKIAEEELKLNMIPFKIKRTLPNGNFEIWTLDELFKDHLLSQLD